MINEFKPNKKYKQSERISLMVTNDGQCTVFVKNPKENPYKYIPHNIYEFKNPEEALKAIEMYRIYGDEDEIAVKARYMTLWRAPINLCPCDDGESPHKATIEGFPPMAWNDEFFWYAGHKITIESHKQDLSEIPEIKDLIHSLKRVKTYQRSEELKFNIEMCPHLLDFIELAEEELGGGILDQETHIRVCDGFGKWEDYHGTPRNLIETYNFSKATIHGLPIENFLNVEEEI